MRASIAFVLLLALAAGAGAPPMAAAAADKALTATGTIASIRASERTVSVTLADGSEARFTWNADTKIGGVLAPGAKVSVRYEVTGDGTNLALQITVSKS